MVNKIIDGHQETVPSPGSFNTSVNAVMSPPVPLIRSTSSSPSRPANLKKANKRPAPYAKRPAKNQQASHLHHHHLPPLKRTVSLKDDENVVKILPSTSSVTPWSPCPFYDRPLPLVPSLSLHKSWHTTDVSRNAFYIFPSISYKR